MGVAKSIALPRGLFPLMNQPTSILNAPETAQLLIDLESRQDQVLRELDELNMRIEQAITFGQLGVRTAANN